MWKKDQRQGKDYKAEKPGKNEKKQSSSVEGVNVILINKYLLLTRQKANKVSMERGKPLSGGKQVIRGDAAFLLNTKIQS